MSDVLFTPQTPGVRPASAHPGSRPPAVHGAAGGTAIAITVHGKPAPQGSKHATLHKQSGRIVTMESSKRVKPWRQSVKEAALNAMDGRTRIEDVPVRVEVIFCFDKPKSAPKRRRTWPITRSSGDVDKLQRALLDALTDAGVFKDDSQVVHVVADKVFTDDPAAPLAVPGAVIRVWEVAPC